MKLLETIDLYKFQAIMQMNVESNVTDVLNLIRAVPHVIIVRTIEEPRLDSKGTNSYLYVLMSIKFLNTEKSPQLSVDKIKRYIMVGGERNLKIDGVKRFIPVLKSLKKIGK